MDSDLVISGLPSNELVAEFETKISQLPQIDLQTHNLLYGQMCARTIFIPAGSVLTGCKTNLDNICVIYGDITVTTSDGPKRLTGFNIIPATSGFKRAGFAHADTWWTTIHHTNLKDMSDIEEEMTDEADNLQTRRLAAIKHETNLALEE